MAEPASSPPPQHDKHGFVDTIVGSFLYSNLSLVLIVLAAVLGIGALLLTPREEDPQIVVPLADIFVEFPGHSATEVEQLVVTPLEKVLYQIDGVEYVYSMAKTDRAIITVRFYVGEDRERSLVKLYKRIDENVDIVPPGVTGWVVKPVEIDDVPIVTLTLRSPTADGYTLRRVGEELVARLAETPNISRATIVGGRPRIVHVYVDPERLAGYDLTLAQVRSAIEVSNRRETAGAFRRGDVQFEVEVGAVLQSAEDVGALVVGVAGDRPVFLKDIATVVDGPAEAETYVRHGWGPAHGVVHEFGQPGTTLGPALPETLHGGAPDARSSQAVTIALAKKRGTNAVWVAQDILKGAAQLKREIVPDDIELVVTRNSGLTADEKVNELVEALGVAIFIVIALLTLGLGWREALIVAVAVPVVFGLTLLVNMVAGYTINRVTLFALILSLGLLVDDPIVDVENIARHFAMRKRATREIVLEAVREIRPPLITATLAVIVSFLPMFFITGMMGPYMRPMALNVPVAMLMSMVVAFTITPWLTYHVLKRRKPDEGDASAGTDAEVYDPALVRQSPLYRLFQPLMAPLMHRRWRAWLFLLIIGALTMATVGIAAVRWVPLKMLPFDNKNELLLVLDFDEGTTLERSDAAVRALERRIAAIPEVTDFTSYVGIASPMDFNGLVRHYYLRQGDNVAEIRLNLAPKKRRALQSHGLHLRERDELTAIARAHGANLKIVETPPGPPVIATLVAEVYGRPDNRYQDLQAAAKTVRARLEAEPGVADVDDSVEADQPQLVFVTDVEKAALSGISNAEIVSAVQTALSGAQAGTLRLPRERYPLDIVVRLPEALRSSAPDLGQIFLTARDGRPTALAELGRWEQRTADQTIYHKNLRRVAYVFAETVGRPPADCVLDVLADKVAEMPRGAPAEQVGNGAIAETAPRPVAARTFFDNGGGIRWETPASLEIGFAGEGEWKITLDVFRDLGLAFAAALVGIYILLVAQTGSFLLPVVVMLAIPLTALGVMPGFWLLNALFGQTIGGYGDPVFFTATGMIGMIALSGIVTRDAIILVDFIHLAQRHGRSLYDAILESRVVRLRPILLTAGTALLSAAPITIDPIFSGLAWSLIFGLLASTLFTLFVIPIAYWLLYAGKDDRARA